MGYQDDDGMDVHEVTFDAAPLAFSDVIACLVAKPLEGFFAGARVGWQDFANMLGMDAAWRNEKQIEKRKTEQFKRDAGLMIEKLTEGGEEATNG